MEKSLLFNLSDSDTIGESDGVLSFMSKTIVDSRMLFPRTCPHEGAKAEQSCFSGERLICPWHGRRLLPIIKITNNQVEILESDNYRVDIQDQFVRIRYNNTRLTKGK
ncbi:uncharacterized protein METZ01_LOCUS481187 [marine metagenome]|uniref:Rieske domain-containing protein n=1 Tax=marine metagenome TaxID=408172 RepID=A0A383C8F0_9ZZZZ